MRIVVTGMSVSMAENKSKVGYESLGPALVKAFGANYHHATQQIPTIATNSRMVREADIIVMGISPLDGKHSKYVIPCLDLLDQALFAGVPVMFYVSDWRTADLMPSVASVLANPTSWVTNPLVERQDRVWGREHLSHLVATVERLQTHVWPLTIVPAHTWTPYDESPMHQHLGAHSADPLVWMDPTAYTTALRPPLDPRSAPPRSWAWVLAALGNYDEWVESLELVWPVRTFGNKVGPKILETEVTQQYRECLGALVPKYPAHGPGPGWWRTRYHSALRAGAVLLGDKDEMHMIGTAFRYPKRDIEALSPAGAHALSVAQLEQFVRQIESTESIAATIQSCIEKVERLFW